MRSIFTTATAAAALMLGFGLAAGPAWAQTDTGDDIEVLSTGDGDTFSIDPNNDPDGASGTGMPSRAVDDDFVSFYSVGEGGQVVISFTDNTALAGNSPDPDIIVWDRCGRGDSAAGVNNADEPVDAHVSQGAGETQAVADETSDGTNPDVVPVPGGGNILNCPISIDLDDPAVNLLAATEVRIVDLCDAANESETLGCDARSGGVDIAEVQALNSLAFGTANISKFFPVDARTEITETGEDSGFDDQQEFTFVIEVTNPGGADLTGFTFQDTVPAEFDVIGSGSDNTNAAVGCTNVVSEEGGAKGKGKGNQQLAPDHVSFNVDLAAGESCTVTVDVATDDDHPGGGNSPTWTPTSCPVGETLTLNDGVEVFETATGNLIFRDDSSLELTCTDEPPEA